VFETGHLRRALKRVTKRVMKILYDHQIFTSQNFGGISRYFYELLRGQQQAELSIVYSDNEYLCADPRFDAQVESKAKVPRASPWARLRDRQGTRRHVLVDKANRAATVKRLRSGDWDVFHPTYYEPYFLDELGGKPYVLTVYDMIHELFPEHFRLDDPVAAHKKLLVDRAAHVIAISASTKRDLMSVYGVPSTKVSVVHLGGSLETIEFDQALKLPQRYLLLVGTRVGYKNCYFAIRALSRLLAAQPDLTLVCAGGGSFSDAELRFFAELGISDRIRYYPAGDAQLATLYRKADAFLFPSLYEGFGIPVIEAFSCECPVVASNTPALMEVAGEAAEYFDPKCLDSLSEAVLRVTSNSRRRAELQSLGKARIAQFSWRDCAIKTAEVYQSILR
jgi:glycosyltransferase involved in cell wall biosynthesis